MIAFLKENADADAEVIEEACWCLRLFAAIMFCSILIARYWSWTVMVPLRSKFAANWPASKSNEETGEALAHVEKSRRTLHGWRRTPTPSRYRWAIRKKESLQISFILNFQVTLIGFRRILRSIPLFCKSIGETEEVLSKMEKEKLNQARYDCCLSTEHHSTY